MGAKSSKPPSERTPLLRDTPAGQDIVEPAPSSPKGDGNQASDVVEGQGSDGPDDGSKDPHSPENLDSRRVKIIIGAVWGGVFLGALDTTIVATLVNSISSDFERSNEASWLGTSYLLSTATFTPLYGRLSDIIGRRAANLSALTLFTIGTAMCAFAPSMEFLVVARLIAGMGGGGLMTTSSIIASDLVPLKRRGLVQGLTNICFGAGSGLGGPIGGILADNLGWRWAFGIQLPLLVISFALVATFVRYTTPGQGKTASSMLKRIDFAGSATLIVSVGALLLGLSFKNNEGKEWSDPRVWAFLVVFGVFGVLFVLAETYISPEPVMPLRLMKQRNPFFIAVANFTSSSIAFSILYHYPLFFEAVKLQSSSEAGLHLIPYSIALSVASLGAGLIMRRTGKYWLLTVISSALPLVSMVLLANMSQNTPPFLDWFNIVPSALGFSSLITALLIGLISAVDRADMAVATGISYLFRYTGQVVGVALSSSILQAVLATELHKRIAGPGAAEIIEQIRHKASIVHSLPPSIKAEAVNAYVIALRWVYIYNGIVAVIGFLVCLPIREYTLPGSFAEEERNRKARTTPPSTEA